MIKTLLTHSAFYSSSLLLARIIAFAGFVLFARHLGPDMFGRYIFFITLIQVITFVGDAGLGQWYQKNVKEGERHHFFAQTIAVRTITFAITAAFSMIAIYLLFGFNTNNFLLFIFALIVESFLSIGEYFYFERRQSHIVGIKQIARAALLIIFYYLASHIFSYSLALVAYIAAATITCLWFFPWRSLLHVRSLHFFSSHKVFKTSYPYALLSLTSLAYARADSLIIGTLVGPVAVGIYSTAYRFLESLSLIPQALTQNLFPISAKKTISKNQLYKLMLVMGVSGGAISLLLFLLTDWIILFFFGEAYAQSVVILKILSFVLLLFFINAPLATVVQSSHLVKKFLPFGVVNTVANVILNIFCIPIFGIQSAAYVMLFTEFTGLSINFYFMQKIYQNSKYE